MIIDKTKKQLIVLILLVFFGANYAIANYAIIPKMNQLKAAQAEYQTQQARLNHLIEQKKKIGELEAELENINRQVAELNNIAPPSIDTPQLVYDFYNACLDYGLTGESISFELREQAQGNNPNPAAQTQEQQGDTNAQGTSQQTNNASVNVRLSINLKVKGDKISIEEFLKNIDKITDRKLNVKSIAITVPKTENKQGTNNIYNPEVEMITPENELYGQNLAGSFDFLDAYEITTDIIFYHYVQLEGQERERVKQYDFEDTEIGFESIADMFE